MDSPKQTFSSKDAESNMDLAHEMMKCDSKNSAIAFKALNGDSSRVQKAMLAEKTHRRMHKVDAGTGGEYFNAAQKIYPYSSYFKGSKSETK